MYKWNIEATNKQTVCTAIGISIKLIGDVADVRALAERQDAIPVRVSNSLR
jgi:hypothetical protein